MVDGSKVLERFKKVGSRWAFEMFLEVFYDDIIEGFRKFLAGYTPEDIPRMVQNNEYPYIDPNYFEFVRGNEKYLEKIRADRLGEALARARPDLAEALVGIGEAGGIYIHKLRAHLLKIITHPEKAHEQGDTLPKAPLRKMKLLTCDSCNQSWPVPENEAASVTKCPFCGVGRDEPAPPEN